MSDIMVYHSYCNGCSEVGWLSVGRNIARPSANIYFAWGQRSRLLLDHCWIVVCVYVFIVFIFSSSCVHICCVSSTV